MLSLLLGSLAASGAAWAQPAAPVPQATPAASSPGSGSASGPAAPSEPKAETATPATPASPTSPAAPGASPQQRIEVTGGRADDTAQRQRSTAAKIVIGREEIDKFGDATLGEVLRRLPGVTTPGAPGRCRPHGRL
ncbi:MAG: hypothetical protein ACKOD9_18210 [Rubrivivax sp.]